MREFWSRDASNSVGRATTYLWNEDPVNMQVKLLYHRRKGTLCTEREEGRTRHDIPAKGISSKHRIACYVQHKSNGTSCFKRGMGVHSTTKRKHCSAREFWWRDASKSVGRVTSYLRNNDRVNIQLHFIYIIEVKALRTSWKNVGCAV